MGRVNVWVAAAAAAVVGCRSAGREPTPLVFTQVPPTVQAAYTAHYRAYPIRDVTRQTRNGEDFYTIRYADADGAKHDVVYNGGGDEIDKH